MCQPDPVRTVLDRLSLEQAQSALGTAQHRLQAARKTGDSDSAEILSRVPDLGHDFALSDLAGR
jgi:hypothetical protein